jgi:multidrug efflux pump subunit AcrA (membrane-fusion protein)
MRGVRPAVLAAAIALAGCGDGNGAAKKASDAPVVTVVAVARDGAAGTVRASGMIGYQRETTLSFKVPGVIARLSVDEGDEVRAGQTLASLNLTEYSANVLESDAALRTAEAQLARAKTLFGSMTPSLRSTEPGPGARPRASTARKG